MIMKKTKFLILMVLLLTAVMLYQHRTFAFISQSVSYLFNKGTVSSAGGSVGNSNYASPVNALGQIAVGSSYSSGYILRPGIVPSMVLAQSNGTGSDTLVTDTLKIVNLSGHRVMITWQSQQSEAGFVFFGTVSPGASVSDARGGAYQGNVHNVVLDDLTPQTSYYYYIVSGNEEYDNAGSYYQFTTSDELLPAIGSNIVYGKIFEADGTTPAQGASVVLKLIDADGIGDPQDSAERAVLTDTEGNWFFDLVNMQNNTHTSWYQYSESDTLEVEAVSISGTGASQQITVGSAEPFPDVLID